MDTFGRDPFQNPASQQREQKFKFKEEEDKRSQLYKSTGVDYDKDIDGRVYAKDSDLNRSLGVRVPTLTDDGRIDLDSRRDSDSHIQGIPDTYAKIEEAKKRRESINAIHKGNRAQLDNFDTQYGVSKDKIDEWDDTLGDFKKVEKVSFAGVTDPKNLKALEQTRKYMAEEAARTEFSINEIDAEIGGYHRTRSEWMRRQREAIGAQEGDVPELDEKPEIGSDEWYQKIEDHGGIVGAGAPRPALPSPHSGDVMDDSQVGATPEGHHRDIESVDPERVKVTDTLMQEQAQPEQTAIEGSSETLSAVSRPWQKFMASTDKRGKNPSEFEQALWITERISDIDANLYEGANVKGQASFDAEKEALLAELPARIEAMNDYQRAALHDKTRDATVGEWLSNFGARTAASVGTGLTDMGEFVQRNFLRFHPAGILSLKARNAIFDGDETAANNIGSRFLGAMRETAEDWGPDVPEEVREKLLSGKGTMFAEGLGSALSFMIPGGAVGKIGKAANLSDKGMKLLMMGSTAAAGSAASGNALRREVVQSNKAVLDQANELLQAGEITREEFDGLTSQMKSQANYAEALGSVIGLSEAIPLGNMLGRMNQVGGSALSEAFLKKFLTGSAKDVLEKGFGKKAIKTMANAMEEMTEEAMQEYGQSVAENAIASGWGVFSDEKAWDHDRELMDGVVEASATGGAVGLTLSLITSAMPGRARQRLGEQLQAEAVNELAFRLAAQKSGPSEWEQLEESERQQKIKEEIDNLDPNSPELQEINNQIDDLIKTPPAQGSGIQPFQVTYKAKDAESGEEMERQIEVFATSMDDAIDQLAERGITNDVSIESAPVDGGEVEIVPTTVFTDKDGNEETVEGSPVEARKKLPEGFEVAKVRPGASIEKKPEPSQEESEDTIDESEQEELQQELDEEIEQAKQPVKDTLKAARESGQLAPTTKDEASKAIKANFKLSEKGNAAVDQVLDAIERVVGEDTFKKVKIQIVTSAQMKKMGLEDRAGGWHGKTGTLMLNKDSAENQGDEAVNSIFHEAGHAIGEAIDDFVSKEFNSLTPEQRKAAALEYDPKDTRSDEELMADKNTRQEWFNFQLFRVAKEGPEAYLANDDVSKTLGAKVVEAWESIREAITKWIGDESLTTEQLDSKIREILFEEQSAPSKATAKTANSKGPWAIIKDGELAMETDRVGLADSVKEGVVAIPMKEYLERFNKLVKQAGGSQPSREAMREEFNSSDSKNFDKGVDKVSNDTKTKGGSATKSASLGVGSGGESTPASTGLSGSQFTTKTPETKSRQVSGRWKVVEADSLFTSQDDGFDQTLQPRDRTRRASKEQINEIAGSLDAERISESKTSDLGSPMVNKSGMVLSGNGRTEAIRLAYAQGKKPIKNYRKWLITEGSKFGLSGSDISGMKNPVLVREIEDFGGMSPVEFARVSNRQQSMGMSLAETAAVDAQIILESTELRELFRPNESAGVMSASNRDFLNQFIEATGDREDLISSDGSGYSPQLESRLKRALIAAAVGPNETQLIVSLTEEVEGLKRVAAAVAEVAPRLVSLQGGPFDLSAELADALRNYVAIVREGGTVEEFLDQSTLFGDSSRSYISDSMLGRFGTHGKRSARKIVDWFNDYINSASKVDTSTEGLNLGIDETTKSDIVSNLDEQESETTDDQSDLPQGESADVRASDSKGTASSRSEQKAQSLSAEDAAFDALGDAFGDLAGTPNTVAYAPETQSNPDFYSQLERVLEKKMPKQAPPSQVRGIIDPSKGSGVKPDEIKWSGIEQKLVEMARDESHYGKVDKAELLAYLRDAGRVRFEEVTRGVKQLPEGYELLEDEGVWTLEYNGYEQEGFWDSKDDAIAAARFSEDLTEDGQATQYSEYVLPNGENYREVVLTLPKESKLKEGLSFRQQDDGDWNLWDTKGSEPGFVFADGQPTREELEAYISDDAMLKDGTDYTSSHFNDIPNYVAHMRLNERQDSEGNDGLFLEEIQSDRHQQGRDKGYRVVETPYTIRDNPSQGVWEIVDENGEAVGRYQTKAEAEDIVAKSKIPTSGVPDAPYRTTWPLAMFKRALRDAVASGKDWIGWTTGETQAERYDLSKQVDSVYVYKSSDGNSYDLEVYRDNEVVTQDSQMSETALADMVGKDLAKKATELDSGSSKSFEGLDLKVGGEGMKGFYDNMLPKAVQKYVKKWGGKVERGTVPVDVKEEIWTAMDGSPVVGVEAVSKNAPIHRVTITDAMLESIRNDGQVAFAPATAAKNQEAKVYNKPLPPEKFDAFIKAARMLADAGVVNADDLAIQLQSRFNGTVNEYSQSIWDLIKPFDQTGTAASDPTPDWDFLYEEDSNPDEGGTVDNTPKNGDSKKDADGKSPDLAGNSGGSTAADAVGKSDVPTSGSTGGREVGSSTRNPESSGSDGQSSGELPTSAATSSGAEGNLELFGEEQSAGSDRSTAKRDESTASSRPNGTRSNVQSRGDESTGVDAGSEQSAGATSTSGLGDPPRDSRIAAQKVANGKEFDVKWGDLQSIAEVAPILLKDQHADLVKIENRFFGNAKPSEFNPNGKGMLITNGTGTGKTFVGLGTAKRFIAAGKKEVLFVVPTGKVADWIEDAGMIGIEANGLENTSMAGEGVTVVGHEAFRMNQHLLTRKFDLVVVDEVHKLTSSKEGNETLGLRQLRILAGHHRSHIELAGAYRDPEWFAAKIKLDSALKPLEARLKEVQPDASIDERAASEVRELEDKINALNQAFYQRFLPKRDEHKAAGEAIYGENKFLGLSATPFAYHKSLEWGNGYIINWDHGVKRGEVVMIGESRQTPQARFFVKHLGYRIRYHKLTQPDANVDGGLMERELSTKLTEAGAMSGRMIALDYDYSRQFILTDSSLGGELDRGVKILNGFLDKDNEFKHLGRLVKSRLNYVKSMQLLESIKAAEAVDRAKKHVAMGRKVVIFHSYLGSAPQHPFKFTEEDFFTAFGGSADNMSEVGKARDELRRFEARYPELINLDFSKVANVLDVFQEEFGAKATYFNGQTLSKKKRQEGMEKFNESGSGVDVMVAQVDAAQEGLSLHDKDGKHQRVLINIGLPVKPVTVAQEEGRIYRVGLMSHAIYENLVLHTDMERTIFGERASERSSTVENLAMGELARNLKEVLRQGYMGADYQTPAKDQGTGGVANDRRIGSTSDFDRAKTYYYGRLKRNSRTKAAEGKDYFATPEPLGAKMVEWANPTSGESMLEPSAGHGAIARFFPETTNNTFIEPSGSLASEAIVNTDGRFEQSDFEEHHIANKYDAIVMNPPFGSGGKTAYDHVAKAVKHLRNGGRIVALVPDGPAATKQFEKFIQAKEHNNIYVPKIITLPPVTFERAGTKVATRILIIDKIDDADFAKEQGFRRYVHDYVELSDHRDINEFFDDIEKMRIPGRVSIPVKETMKKTKAKAGMAELMSGRDGKLPSAGESVLFDVGEQKHTKTGEQLYSAKAKTKVGDWQEMKSLFSEHGGYWSRFAKAILFDSKEGRDSFVQAYEEMIASGDAAGTPAMTDSELDALMDDMAYAPREKGSETQERVIGETIGDLKDTRSIFGRFRDYFTDLRANDWLRVRQGIFDSFAAIREYEKNIFGKRSVIDAAASGHKMALMTKNLPSVMMQVITKGTLEYVDGSIRLKEGSRSLTSILNMVGDKRIKLWEGYVAAVRSKRLLAEGKENNFADDPEGMEGGMTADEKIDELLALAEQYPEFEEARLAYQEWNSDMLDFAESAGIINPSTREVWEKNDYVPFYRMAESVDGKITGPKKQKGLAGQNAGIRQLKGGEGRVAVIENIYKNAEKLIDASFKNIAMQRITDLAGASDGVLEPIPHKAVPFKVLVKEVKQELEKSGVDTDGMTDEDLTKMVNFWRMKAPKGEDVVSVSYNGKPKYFKVNDPHLLSAILDLGPQEQSTVLKILGKPKQLLTAAITLDPVFMVANWMRDSLNAYFVSESALRPGIDSVKGIVDTMAESDSYHSIMASGGSSGAFQRLQDKDIRRKLSGMTKGHKRKVAASIIDSPHRAINVLKRVGRASEMANRVAVYDAAIRGGASPQEAAYQAMDLTNFTMHGSSQVIRTFTSIVPFLNARLQGLYKLGRSATANPKRFAAHAAVMTSATLALMLKNWDDERYWELEDWDRDLYYHMWFGDEHIRIPKPFEVGAVFSTIPERITEAIFKRGDSDLLLKSLGTTAMTTFAFNPIPQAVMPLVEQYGNLKFFGWSPIVSGGDQHKSPEQQFSPWTSETFREIAKAMPDSAPDWMRSPKRLEHLWRGYTGTIGTYVADISDMLTRKAMDYPDQPDFGASGIPILENMRRRFNPEDDTRSNRYVGEFYELYNKVLKVEQGIRDAIAEGDKVSVDKLRSSNQELLSKSDVIKKTSSNMSKVRKAQNQIYYDPFMDKGEKAEKLKELNKRRNLLARNTVRLPDPTR